MRSVDVVIPCVPQHVRHLHKLLITIKKNTQQPNNIVIALSETNDAKCRQVATALEHLAYPTPVIMTCVPKKAYAAENRNRGAAVSDADVLMFMDADDAMFPNAIAATLEVMHAHRADAVYHGFSRDPAYSESPAEARAPTVDPASFAMIEKADRSEIHLTRLPMHHGHVAVRRHAYLDVGGQNEAERWRRPQDAKFMRDVCRAGHRVAFTPRKLTLYNEHLSAEQHPTVARRPVHVFVPLLVVMLGMFAAVRYYGRYMRR